MPLLGDTRYALRVLVRSPLFSVTAVLSLAVGIAASTSIYSLADAMWLRPRAGIVDPETVVEIGRTIRGEGFDNFGYPLFKAMRERNTTLAAMAALRLGPNAMSLGGAETSERVFAALVSGNYFQVLGTRPALGRFFISEEDATPGTHPVIVLNHRFWVDRFQGRRDVIGQTVPLNGLAYTIVGVAEAGFTGTNVLTTDFWVPFAMEAHVRGEPNESLLANERAVWHTAIGRLKPGVTPRQAQQELDAITKNYLRERGDDRANRWGMDVVVSSRLPKPAQGPVLGFIAVLGTLTMLVLIIACSNVAGMQLARAIERRREVATRLAIGASRRRIIFQLLVEGVVLALGAAVLSVPLTNALTGLLGVFRPNIPLPIALDLEINPRVLSVSIALAMFAALLFALLPALQATRFEIAPALHGATSTTDRKRARLRQTLVVAQIAMALLLLVATGLFLRSLQQAATVDQGFNVRNVDILEVDMRLAGYRGSEGVRAVNELIDRFRAVPGVTTVGASRIVPLQSGGLGLGGLRAPGYNGPNGRDEIEADWDVVSTDYFRALELPIVRGRGFTTADREGAPDVAIVNETMAERVWAGRDPVGQQLLQRISDDQQRTLTVVGVAKRAKYRSIGEPPRNFIYVPEAQQFLPDVTFYLRRTGDESRLQAARAVVQAFNPSLPVIDAQTLEQATALSLLPQRLAAWVAGSVGSVGLLLAALGLYGLTSFSVARRTREIAVRMALGASREAVLSLVLRQSLTLAAIGGAVGFGVAAGVSALLTSFLVGIQPLDPLAFASAVGILGAVLIGAAWTPARRASRMNPMMALRSE